MNHIKFCFIRLQVINWKQKGGGMVALNGEKGLNTEQCGTCIGMEW